MKDVCLQKDPSHFDTKRNETNNYYNLDLMVDRNETILMNGRCSMLILITPEIKPRDDQKRCEH